MARQVIAIAGFDVLGRPAQDKGYRYLIKSSETEADEPPYEHRLTKTIGLSKDKTAVRTVGGLQSSQAVANGFYAGKVPLLAFGRREGSHSVAEKS